MKFIYLTELTISILSILSIWWHFVSQTLSDCEVWTEMNIRYIARSENSVAIATSPIKGGHCLLKGEGWKFREIRWCNFFQPPIGHTQIYFTPYNFFPPPPSSDVQTLQFTCELDLLIRIKSLFLIALILISPPPPPTRPESKSANS